MTEAAINHHRQPEPIKSGRLERFRLLEPDGVVSIMGVRTGIGLLVTVNGCTIGLVEPDGSEEVVVEKAVSADECKNMDEKPVDEISRLKDIILAQTRGDTQKIALYLAEQRGIKVKLSELAKIFKISTREISLILKTISDRAQRNDWPFLISFSQSAGVSFTTRKKFFDNGLKGR